MTDARRAGGCIWSAVNFRIVTARLKFMLRDGSPKWITLVSCYAPTVSSARAVKNQFFDRLQSVLSEVSQSDHCIVGGDFNARVGAGLESGDWRDICRVHGFGDRNSSGIELLSFAALNQLCISNTMFPKRDIFKRTWQHPGSLHWHCIDYITVRKDDKFVYRCMRCTWCWMRIWSPSTVLAFRVASENTARTTHYIQVRKTSSFWHW